MRRCALALSLLVALVLIPADVGAQTGPPLHTPRFSPGADGIGDPYFPLDGNGGYDVSHYDLRVTYHPPTDKLSGVAVIQARATQNLSRFNLDLKRLTVRGLVVNGQPARWKQQGNELVVTPVRPLLRGQRFAAQIRYDGYPQPNDDPILGGDGFIPTDDGAMVLGEPHVASSWFPVNDHPSDKASYDIAITVPKGLQAVSNGDLVDQRTKGVWTTWRWRATAPMASYLAVAAIGRFDLHAYQAKGISYLDAVDPDLFTPVAAPRTGTRAMISQLANTSYKRLTRTISVPEGGAQLSYWVTRHTEQNWDYTFVEVHTVGKDDWTTLPDADGHTSAATGRGCPYWLGLHPFLAHYQTDNGDGSCSASGTTGTWSAASGDSDGPEQWRIDLSAYAGEKVEVSISYASDDLVQHAGLLVDDIVVSTGEGSTSFESDGNVLDGWIVPGPPAGSAPNENDWIVGTAAQLPPPTGTLVQASFARQPEILDFLARSFGPYPFTSAGGIVDDVGGLGFALENQTRPTYSKEFFSDYTSPADGVVVHELAHQWFGDSVALARWQDIWLNEGFATYAEWLWSEHEGQGTPQQISDFYLQNIPSDDPFWTVVIGDPTPQHLFDDAVYIRGGLTLEQLRLRIGDERFFRLLRTWARVKAGGNVTTPQFVALAERVSGQQLDEFFRTWLLTPAKPDVPVGVAATATRSAAPEFAALVARQRAQAPRG